MENEAISTEFTPKEEVLPTPEELGEGTASELPETLPPLEAGEEDGTAGSEGDERTDTYYRELAESDLAEIRESGAGIRTPGSLSELRDPYRYGELRAAGLSPLEAYLATEGRELLLPTRDGRAHLAPSIGRAAVGAGGRMATGDLLSARELFPSLSDSEIESLWRRTRGAR